MTYRKWTGIATIVLCSSWLAPATAMAASDGFTLNDIELNSAGDLVDVCTVQSDHEHYDSAVAFCYGFFEGAIRYHQAIAGTEQSKKLVCAPDGTTRLQAVDVFVGYLQANPQYSSEGTVDTIFRALMARWPCGH